MKATILVNGITFLVSAKLTKPGTFFPFTKECDKHTSKRINGYKISVKVGDNKTSFDFYGSIHDFQNNITEMSESDIKHALYCFVSDACSAKQSFEEFCNELGYDTDSRTAEKIYKACEKSLAKFEKLTTADIYDIVNELND